MPQTTLTHRLSSLEQWKIGNGSRGAEMRLQDIEKEVDTMKDKLLIGDYCPYKNTIKSLGDEVKKLNKMILILIILTGALTIQLAPDFIKVIVGLI